MDKRLAIILGSLFILTSGLMFTIERLTAHVYWLAQINTGKYDTNPQSIPLFTNVFLGLFLIIGVIFIIISFQEKN